MLPLAVNQITQPLYIGCAGWSVPKEQAAHFPSAGSHLERYAQRLSSVEINSSFYRPHRPATYGRWAESVPESFRFAVKIPREITHLRRLKDIETPWESFLGECNALGEKLGPLLVQLPPSLAFDSQIASSFFQTLREQFAGEVVCEPRHRTWFTLEADQLLVQFQVARVAADPAVLPAAAVPGGWNGLTYYRWHGSPQMYYSAYSEEALEALARDLKTALTTGPAWCIFDNTALAAATADALRMVSLL